jgi:hypothetical protein
VAIFEIGTHVSYKGRLYVVVGFTPIGVTPRLLELEDVQSGRIREVEPSDPDLASNRWIVRIATKTTRSSEEAGRAPATTAQPRPPVASVRRI